MNEDSPGLGLSTFSPLLMQEKMYIPIPAAYIYGQQSHHSHLQTHRTAPQSTSLTVTDRVYQNLLSQYNVYPIIVCDACPTAPGVTLVKVEHPCSPEGPTGSALFGHQRLLKGCGYGPLCVTVLHQQGCQSFPGCHSSPLPAVYSIPHY